MDLANQPHSPKTGHDEGFMQGFTARHLVGILNPMAEHVKELAAEVNNLRKDLQLTDAKAEQNKAINEQHDRELLALQTVDGQTQQRLDKMQTELQKQREEKARLEGDHEMTKAHILKTEERLQHTIASLGGLRRLHENLEAKVAQLQVDGLNTQKVVAGQGDSLIQLRESHEGLSGRHLNLSREHIQAKENGDATTKSHLALMAKYDLKHQEDVSVHMRLSDHCKVHDKVLTEINNTLHMHAGTLRSNEADIDQLRTFLEHGKKIEQLQGMLTDSVEALKKQNVHISKVEDRVDRISDGFVEEKQHVGDNLRDLHRKLNSMSCELHVVEDTMTRRDDHQKKADAFVGELHRDHRNLKESAASMERELGPLLAWQRAAICKMDSHQQEHYRTQSELNNLGKTLDVTHAGLVGLKGDLGSTNVTIAKLGSRFDTCDKDVQGMSKGFQDTFGHVLRGEKGLIPPSIGKSIAAKELGLPAIAPITTPRWRTDAMSG